MTLEDRIQKLYEDVCNRNANWLDGIKKLVEEEVKARLEAVDE